MTACTEACQARHAELDARGTAAAQGAARVAARLRWVDGHQRRQAVTIVVLKDALERISWLPHDHGTTANPKPCARCIALAALEGSHASD